MGESRAYVVSAETKRLTLLQVLRLGVTCLQHVILDQSLDDVLVVLERRDAVGRDDAATVFVAL